MKLVCFDDFKVGLMRGQEVVDVTDVVKDIPHMGPGDLMSRLIERFDEYRPKLAAALASKPGIAAGKVRFRSPLPKPGKIVCMAVNYMEDGTRPAPPPINAFIKSPTAVIGDGDTVVLSPDKATTFEQECELGMVIGKHASHVNAKDWKQYVFGYLNFNDVSSRGLGAQGQDSFYPTKSQHTSAPMGPYLVTADEIADPQKLSAKFWDNGELRQDYNTSDMAHKLPRVVEWTSSVTTLEPGDVIATGTNHWGLGPLMDGDILEQEIEGLGRLHLKVKDDQHREWRRETHRQKEAREAAEKAAAAKK